MEVPHFHVKKNTVSCCFICAEYQRK